MQTRFNYNYTSSSQLTFVSYSLVIVTRVTLKMATFLLKLFLINKRTIYKNFCSNFLLTSVPSFKSNSIFIYTNDLSY